MRLLTDRCLSPLFFHGSPNCSLSGRRTSSIVAQTILTPPVRPPGLSGPRFYPSLPTLCDLKHVCPSRLPSCTCLLPSVLGITPFMCPSSATSPAHPTLATIALAHETYPSSTLCPSSYRRFFPNGVLWVVLDGRLRSSHLPSGRPSLAHRRTLLHARRCLSRPYHSILHALRPAPIHRP